MDQKIARYRLTSTTYIKGIGQKAKGSYITVDQAADINYSNCEPCDHVGLPIKPSVGSALDAINNANEMKYSKFNKTERFSARNEIEKHKDIRKEGLFEKPADNKFIKDAAVNVTMTQAETSIKDSTKVDVNAEVITYGAKVVEARPEPVAVTAAVPENLDAPIADTVVVDKLPKRKGRKAAADAPAETAPEAIV